MAPGQRARASPPGPGAPHRQLHFGAPVQREPPIGLVGPVGLVGSVELAGLFEPPWPLEQKAVRPGGQVTLQAGPQSPAGCAQKLPAPMSGTGRAGSAGDAGLPGTPGGVVVARGRKEPGRAAPPGAAPPPWRGSGSGKAEKLDDGPREPAPEPPGPAPPPRAAPSGIMEREALFRAASGSWAKAPEPVSTPRTARRISAARRLITIPRSNPVAG